ncbi:MAG TPA: YidC/Oxa1 family membrane protein insertase, partial [Desulfosporosinus sp.]|nr:YidC/Oxa1 family membrane protein insertase [Desulfosporosinus sp.]
DLLTKFIGLTGDWFVAVILVTLVIRICLLPLSVKQQKDQFTLSNLNQVKSVLTTKFKNQTEKIDLEVMKIASKYKVNTFLSMLLIIIQAPILFSLYASIINLSTSVGSLLVPWILSVHAPDSFHVLPILAGVFQALGGFTAETKSVLMFIVPVVIGLVFLWKAPAVLSVYWMTNSALKFLEYKMFSLNAIRNRLLKIPSAEEMLKSVS